MLKNCKKLSDFVIKMSNQTKESQENETNYANVKM
jgi:hypothetical protein